MESVLIVRVVELDNDYLGIDIIAANDRFKGTAFIYTQFKDLGAFANQIEGFPSSAKDERKWEFGNREQRYAGGFVGMHFYCHNAAAHATLKVSIEDDNGRGGGSAQLSLLVFAADLDRFVVDLREMVRVRAGEATLRRMGRF